MLSTILTYENVVSENNEWWLSFQGSSIEQSFNIDNLCNITNISSPCECMGYRLVTIIPKLFLLYSFCLRLPG